MRTITLTPWQLATIVLAILALGLGFWAGSLRSDVGRLQSDLDTANQTISDLRSNASATVYQLIPTDTAPAESSGQAWFSLSGSGVITVFNMPQPGSNEIYQIWYISDDPKHPTPGGTFQVDEHGQGYAIIPADTGGITAIAVSLEPGEGSETPSGPYLLQSDVSEYRG